MIENTLFFIHYALTLLFGIVLSFGFCGLRLTKKNNLCILLLFAFCGMLQWIVFRIFGEQKTWELYPLIAHLPLGLVLRFGFRKKAVTILASISLSYLCCQPSKWIGLLFEEITHNDILVWIIRICVVIIVGFVIICHLASLISEMFNKNIRSVLIFSCVPFIYYLFDYVVGVYTDMWVRNHIIVAEFLSFYLCVAYMIFCVVYYKAYEKKADAERKEQIVKLTVQQQAKELEAVKKSNLETALLRHDMRLLLSNLALSIEKNDKENTLKMISGFAAQVDATTIHRYCKNDIINYILTNYENKCKEINCRFQATIELDDIYVDEILLSSIISNALDNAYNAQNKLPESQRQIKLMLKDTNGKLLLSVKNAFKEVPVFIDGIPISHKKGHGYGTQSIRYMTEKLGGKCQFSIQNDLFILRVII